MLDLTLNFWMLRGVALAHLARDVARKRHPDVRHAADQRALFYDTVWRRAARDLGADINSPCQDILEVTLNDARVLVRSNYTSLDDPVTLFAAGNKPFVHRRLADHGLPTPESFTFSLRNISQAVEFLQRSPQVCVVKPAAGTGAGQGVTTGIRTRTQLAKAASRAARYHSNLVIEQQVPGRNYRLLFLDGLLLDAVHRRPPNVVGDGKSTIRTLIRQENMRRQAGWEVAQVQLQIDSDMKQTLAAQNMSLRSKPAAKETVELKTVINDNAARDNVPAMTTLCPEIIAAAARAANVLQVRLAGVDVITPDPSQPLQQNGGVILEVNTTPGLYHHKRGDQCPVAVTILKAMLREKHCNAPSASCDEY